MIIIGEKINATRKAVAAAIRARDEKYIIAAATEQVQAGADYLDVNAGDPTPEVEVANMQWLVGLVQGNVDVPLCIDSASPQAMAAGLALAEKKAIVNSISLEAERLQAFLPVIADHDCMVIALCMSDEGTPIGAEDRVARAAKLIEHITAAGKRVDEIIVDPCFFPVSAEPGSPRQICQAIAEIRRQFPEVLIGGGLSNVSYGLPQRRLINLAMLAVATCHGMNAAIIDPCAPGIVPMILAAEVISGADQWCAKYVAAHREGKLKAEN